MTLYSTNTWHHGIVGAVFATIAAGLIVSSGRSLWDFLFASPFIAAGIFFVSLAAQKHSLYVRLDGNVLSWNTDLHTDYQPVSVHLGEIHEYHLICRDIESHGYDAELVTEDRALGFGYFSLTEHESLYRKLREQNPSIQWLKTDAHGNQCA